MSDSKILLRATHKSRERRTQRFRLSVEEQINALLSSSRGESESYTIGFIACRNPSCTSCHGGSPTPASGKAALGSGSCQDGPSPLRGPLPAPVPSPRPDAEQESGGRSATETQREAKTVPSREARAQSYPPATPGLYDPTNGLVRLNVGGRRFLTRYTTLTCNGCQDNFFTSLLSGRFPVDMDDKGYIFIDKNASYFEQVLDFLRTGELHCPPSLSMSRLVREATFYGVQVERQEVEQVDGAAAPLTDQALKELISEYKQSRLEKNYMENKEGLQLVEKALFRGLRAEARRGRQLVVRFWPAVETIISRCRQKWGDVVINDLPPFMVNDEAHVFDNALYEVCKIGQEGLCWHLANESKLRVLATDSSDYLTTHTYTKRDGILSINTYAWCVVSTEITPHVYHAAEAVSIVWSPYDVDDPEVARLLSNPTKKQGVKP